MVQNPPKNAWCWEVHHYILIGGGKVTKLLCMAPKGSANYNQQYSTIGHYITSLAKCSA